MVILCFLFFPPKVDASCRWELNDGELFFFGRVHSMVEKLAQFTDIRCCLVVGGLSTKVYIFFCRCTIALIQVDVTSRNTLRSG